MRKKFFLIPLIIIISYLLINQILGNYKFKRILNSYINTDTRQIIKKYLFPYMIIRQQEEKINNQKEKINNQIMFLSKINLYMHDIQIKKGLKEISFKKNEIIKLKNTNLKLEKFLSEKNFFINGNGNAYPGSAYIDVYKDKIYLLTSIGIIGVSSLNDNGDEIIFKQIKNNIEDFLGIDQFEKSAEEGGGFTVKDVKIFNNKFYISYTNEVETNCWNTSIIVADLNNSDLKFNKFFSPDECIHPLKNEDKEFNAHQSGGRIIFLDDETLVFSIGDYKNRMLAQKKDSVFGKIIKININSKEFEIISLGHRNPQGLYYDKNNNFLLSTEHGPKMGDEINLIKLDQSIIYNYGWPIASYGEHYGSTNLEEIYKKYPLHKSHKKYGFIEPLHYFIPNSQVGSSSIGMSEIIGLNKEKSYVASSLNGKSLFFFNLSEENKILNFENVNIGERIRDLFLYDNKIFLFLETTTSLGIINIKEIN